jgi:hypothetical protein
VKIGYRQLRKRLTGISTPFGGASWIPPEPDRDIVRRLMTFLEDRRVLYTNYSLEVPDWVTKSVLEIRQELTAILKSLDEDSPIVPHLKAMRAACRKFLDQTQGQARRWRMDAEILMALGEMRGVFGILIAQLCSKYKIDVEGDLAESLPVEDA